MKCVTVECLLDFLAAGVCDVSVDPFRRFRSISSSQLSRDAIFSGLKRFTTFLFVSDEGNKAVKHLLTGGNLLPVLISVPCALERGKCMKQNIRPKLL